VIPLDEGTKVQNAEDEIKKPHSFAVTTPSKSYTVHERLEWDKRTYYFVAKDDKEKLEWMLAIQRAKPAMRNQVDTRSRSRSRSLPSAFSVSFSLLSFVQSILLTQCYITF
jgi:hypothetical protein